jgi:hypothetical protein
MHDAPAVGRTEREHDPAEDVKRASGLEGPRIEDRA